MYGVVAARLPHFTLHEALTTGKRYDAGAAIAAHIAYAGAPEDDVLPPRAIALATELSGKNPGVVSTHKQLMYGDVLRLGGG
jgi:enoyl-CoA hydratase/carnithine racemase